MKPLLLTILASFALAQAMPARGQPVSYVKTWYANSITTKHGPQAICRPAITEVRATADTNRLSFDIALGASGVGEVIFDLSINIPAGPNRAGKTIGLSSSLTANDGGTFHFTMSENIPQTVVNSTISIQINRCVITGPGRNPPFGPR